MAHQCTTFKFDVLLDEYVCLECGAIDAGDDREDDDYEPSTCPHCNGTGIDVWTGLEDCEYCDGMGYKWWE